jgi:hypothetical protein
MTCQICGWNKGNCERHHKIPMSENGEDCKENIILICPNHHSEAHNIGHINFNKKYNLTGVECSKEKNKAKFRIVLILQTLITQNREFNYSEFIDYWTLKLYYKLTDEDCIAYSMGITVKQLIKMLTLGNVQYRINKYQKNRETFLSKADVVYKQFVKASDSSRHNLFIKMIADLKMNSKPMEKGGKNKNDI